MEGSVNADIWEGLCGRCGEWIPLVSSKKKGTTWFRHAYKVRPVLLPPAPCPLPVANLAVILLLVPESVEG